MKKLSILVIICFLFLEISGQENYFGINLGASIPKDQLAASTDIFSNGYAMSGFSIQFDGIYFPMSLVGVGGMLGFGSLYMDNSTYLDGFVDYLGTNPEYSGLSIPAAGDFKITPGFWNYFNVFVGPELALPVGRFQFGLRAMGGLSSSFYPKIEVSYSDDTDSYYSETRGAHIALGYTYGGGLMFKLNSGSALKLSADYFTGSSRHNFDLDIDSLIGKFSESRKEDVRIEALHVSLGLFYLF